MTITEDASVQVVAAAFAGMVTGPVPLLPQLRHFSSTFGHDVDLGEIRSHIEEGPDDPLTRIVESAIRKWDSTESALWTSSTERLTEDRRSLIYSLMDLDGPLRQVIADTCPVYHNLAPIVIAKEHDLWYDPATNPGYFWNSYADYLRTKKGFPESSLAALDTAASDIVARLTDPTQASWYQSKGLVVGYVQSGKTANFTGVIAKAADAGYRLFIVLSGTTNILRDQTQRRIDKELVGRPMLQDAYSTDEDYDMFINHGSFPSEQGAFDWERLTGPHEDYQQLGLGVSALDFAKAHPELPLNALANLNRAPARILVIKKNGTVLRRLAHDLKNLKAPASELPALIIDDESDQASPNTKRPTQKESLERSRINHRITSLLNVLPRAQYVGYTATPFANVFIDMFDPMQLFPKDFVVSLPRPNGYMGAGDFHDLGDVIPEGYASNERAFVRNVVGDDIEQNNLLRAVDSFVLAGAIKLMRQKADQSLVFRHHTMLVHVSHLVKEQRAMKELLLDVFARAGYNAGPGLARLQELWETDHRLVSAARAPSYGGPHDFESLREHIGACLAHLNDTGDPIIVVNGSPEADHPDFDAEAVWKVVVGGSKLSRGYTIEGLTVSYYRRRARTADTLMQMGRWFGFRAGYEDLVRLFIGRDERGLDLYRAFEGALLDELSFRDEIEKYSSLDPAERITPRDLPPLVSSHLLLPTAKNKMYNAELLFRNFGGTWTEPTLAPDRAAAAQKNEILFKDFISSLDLSLRIVGAKATTENAPISEYPAQVASVPPDVVIDLLSAYTWLGQRRDVFAAQLDFMRGGSGDPGIQRWLWIAPQLVRGGKDIWNAGGNDLSVAERMRMATGRLNAYTEPRHRPVAHAITGSPRVSTSGDIVAYELGPNCEDLGGDQCGVFMFFPVKGMDQEGGIGDTFVTMGFALLFPKNSIATQLRFGLRNREEPDTVVLDV